MKPSVGDGSSGWMPPLGPQLGAFVHVMKFTVNFWMLCSPAVQQCQALALFVPRSVKFWNSSATNQNRFWRGDLDPSWNFGYFRQGMEAMFNNFRVMMHRAPIRLRLARTGEVPECGPAQLLRLKIEGGADRGRN
jgi:hypothetical protein